MSNILSLEQIMNADDLPSKIVEVPAWGGSIRIKQLTKAQQHEIRTTAVVDGVLNDQMLEMGILVASIVEPNLTREHMEMLANKNADVIDEVLAEVFTLSALDKEAISRAREEFPDGQGEVDGVPSGEVTGDDGAEAEAGDAAV